MAEGGSIVYTATLTNPAGTPVTVTLSNGSVITIEVGKTTGTVTVPAPADDVYKDAGKVEVSIAGTTGGNFENLVPSTVPAVTEVTDTIDTSTVKLTADTSVAEGGTVTYTATVGAPVTGSPVTVTLANGQTITIEVGKTTGTVTTIAPNDALIGHFPLTNAITSVKGGNYEILTATGPVLGTISTNVTDTIDTTNLSLAAPALVNEGGSILYTATLTNAADTPVTITLSNDAVITIEAGKTTGTVTVPAVVDDVYKDAGKVEVTIKNAIGGNFENLVPSTIPAVTEVTDTIDNSTVKLTADTSVAEGGTVTYTATVGAPVTGSPMVVTLANGQSITIEVGKTTGTITTIALDDALTGQVLTNVITDVTGGNYENLVVDKMPVNTSVTDTVDTTNLSLTATNRVAEGDSIVYTATLTNAAGSPVTVMLSNDAVITIEGGDTSGTVTVPAPADDAYKNAGKVEVTITIATGGNFENLLPSTVPAVTNVTDTIDTTIVKLTASETVVEGGTVTYTATVGKPVTGSSVVVTLVNGQQITIDIGKTTGTVTTIAPNDALIGHVPLTNAITSVKGGNYEILTATGPVLGTISTNVTDTIDTTTVSITGSTSVTEGQTASYTVSLTQPAQTEVLLKIVYSGNVANGSDFMGVYTVKIPAGASSARFNVATIDDKITEGTENFVVKIDSATGGNFENLAVSSTQGSVSTSIIDIDMLPVWTRLLGGADDNIQLGSGGSEVLDGGESNDILLGDTGDDILIGGPGANTFVWKAGYTGNYVIEDFNTSEGDRIDLRDLLQGESGSTIDNLLKITTVDGVPSLQVNSDGKFKSGEATAATANLTIKLAGSNWSTLIAGSDPNIKVDHNNI